jgi:hypothetical protein
MFTPTYDNNPEAAAEKHMRAESDAADEIERLMMPGEKFDPLSPDGIFNGLMNFGKNECLLMAKYMQQESINVLPLIKIVCTEYAKRAASGKADWLEL